MRRRLRGRAWLATASGLALGCGVLLASGCAGGPAGPAAQQTSALNAGTARTAAAAQYLAIAQAGNRRLDRDFDGLDGRDRVHLAAAAADLRDAAATERLFDRRLLAITFPPETAKTARVLVTANQARARLAARAASSASLHQLAGYQQQLVAANRPVESAVRMIRSQLGLPPADTS